MAKWICLILCTFVSSIYGDFTVTSSAFKDMCCLPSQFTLCKATSKDRITSSSDISPPLEWIGAPDQTQSYVLLVTDPDAISSPYYDMPKHKFKKTAPRETIYHWVLADILPTVTNLPEGAGSTGFVEGGKPTGQTAYGITGMNVYTQAFKDQAMDKVLDPKVTDDAKLDGIYGGYDGGCPPWNDSVPHHYTFTIYALDVPSLNLPEDGKFSGDDVISAMQTHIIDEAELVGLFSTNPTVIKEEHCPCKRGALKN